MKKGFTVVELLVVIVVLAILSTLATFGYRAWRSDTERTVVVSDLKAAASAMEQYQNFNNSYPSSVPSTYTGQTVMTVWPRDTNTAFCLRGVSKSGSTTLYWRSNEGVERTTAC